MKFYTTNNKVANYPLTQEIIDYITNLPEDKIKESLAKNIKYNNTLNFRDLFFLCYEEGVFIDPDEVLRENYEFLINNINMNKIYKLNQMKPLNYQVNEAFLNQIKGGKKYPNKFKQAAYYYFKLCFYLRQDIYYTLVNFLDHQRILYFEKDINYLENISIANNQVCCFDFAATLNYLLSSIGLLPINVVDDKYGTANHVASRFYCDGILFSFDPWLFVEKTDLYNLKMHKKFKGVEILCGASVEQKKHYLKELNEVYLDVVNEIENKSKATFSSNGKNFIELIFEMLGDFPHKNKLQYHLSKLLETHLKGAELKDFVHQEIVPKINKTENIRITTVCNTISFNYTYIVAINTENDYKYILLEDNGQVAFANEQDILSSVIKGEYMIDEDCHYILGIDKSIQFQDKQDYDQDVVKEILDKVKVGAIYTKETFTRKRIK